jgi:Zn-dependent protease with chaperone function
MSISAQRVTTTTRLLIAGLTALLIGISALIGGMFLSVFAVFAVAMNVVGYWSSDRLALKASRAEPVEPGAQPELDAMVQYLAHRAQVPVPRLYTVPSEQPNAFATGRNPAHARQDDRIRRARLAGTPRRPARRRPPHRGGRLPSAAQLLSRVRTGPAPHRADGGAP